MTRLTISDTAERYIESWADQVERGELSIASLPRSLQRLIFIGFADGLAIAKQQAAEFEHQLDQAYLQSYSPKDRQEELQRRLDRHFAQQDALFFAEPQGSAVNERRAA
ncbi:hypothetical protein ICL81_04515 [Leucobacter sp. cx-328]|uniref:hypothetical protein n=1 Tax=unclassified Leucobacter TaxID=2621730 RepID=UPI00165D6E64|nr:MULTISPECIES: hypothetical protein [unclassified Leucobacter]MBC9943789.1 hypothetical protein [Leucobacter sp. cx-328]